MPYNKVASYLKKKHKVDVESIYGPLKPHEGFILKFDAFPFTVLWIKPGMGKRTVSIVAHEVLHFVMDVAARANIPTSAMIDGIRTDESLCYLMEFYMDEIIKKL